MKRRRGMTPMMDALLRLAVLDGGKVVLSGIDRREWMDGRTDNAAKALHIWCYGRIEPYGFHDNQFEINDFGREYVKETSATWLSHYQDRPWAKEVLKQTTI